MQRETRLYSSQMLANWLNQNTILYLLVILVACLVNHVIGSIAGLDLTAGVLSFQVRIDRKTAQK
ncbi:MAG: hypothetical protein H0X03_00660 [Nitrosopumilus sp.]|nr:hypothetical protein [Nitrosopumilus sp.]